MLNDKFFKWWISPTIGFCYQEQLVIWLGIVSELDKLYRVTLKSKFRLCIKKM